jgi:hypothetical protein
MRLTIKRLLAGVAVAASFFSLSAPASATLTNWYLNTSGTGFAGAVLVKDYIDLTGTAYAHNAYTSPTTFTFNEVGTFTGLSIDGGPASGGSVLSPYLTADFIGSGVGNVGGDLIFNSGLLNVFSAGTQIGIFTLQAGSANLQAGTVLPNGAVSFIFGATFLHDGYFFTDAGLDLATLLGSPGGVVLGFATTNAIPVDAAEVRADLVTAYNTAFDTDFGTVANDLQNDLYLSNNGQFRLSVTAVPEPSVLSLFGLALLGLGFSSRRRLFNS